VGADDPHRLDEPPRRRLVPSRLLLPARGGRAPGHAARRSLRSGAAQPGYDLAATDAEQADDEARLATLTAGSRCSFDELVAARWVERPHDLPAAWVEDHLERAGGWRLAPPLLVEQLAGIDAPAPLVLTPRRQVRHLNAQLDFLGETADVVVHPDDAAAAGIVDGEPVLVRSAQGELTGTAKLDGSVRPGVVSIPHGHQRANVNVLTSKDDLDPPTGMTRYSGVPVSLHPVPQGHRSIRRSRFGSRRSRRRRRARRCR
jgi:anaerobic selenocysteine-containing dehydrogenase